MPVAYVDLLIGRSHISTYAMESLVAITLGLREPNIDENG
jgi:hypothetical protein